MTVSNLDAFLDKLQEEIFDEAKQALGERGFHRWRNPRYNGRMENPDGWGRVTGECGDTMEIYLKFSNNQVADASYFTDGCASSMVSGSFAAELTLGKTPEELTDITADHILAAIGRLPENDLHCTTLAARTIQAALDNYMGNMVKQG
ncbi:iron-sulfur cluster assembly scaffold protein [uncultured Desulfobacter sp.]|uniref:iron-sulfur cluster assembly scaffold protein n=1 Tax=uncultured Desulfobacter sp. TaxID=240139 RepID=UPI002AAB38FB|nr:iron-sulfur cluster assembly scaffold protein [uncultured Desulfobacter sp.]